MKFGNPTKILAVATIVLSIGAAYAEDNIDEPSMFSLSGFGTLGVSQSSNNQADFSSTVFHPNGAGYTRNWSADVDTKLGLQVNGDFTDQLSGVIQVISMQNYDNTYRPSIEWANLSYKLTPDLIVRYGRTVWPLLLRSETQNVGYGNPFVRNTTEHLANMPNTFNDGLDITYRFPIGAASNSLQLLYGKSDVNYPGAGPMMGQNYLYLRNTRGFSDTIEYGDLKVHLAYMRLSYDWLYFDFPLQAVPYTTWTAGFNYDPGDWYITADLLKAQDKSYGYFTALMFGGGYRIGNWTPYAFTSSLTQDSMGDIFVDPTWVWSKPGDKQTVTAVGVRWDFMKNTDFKLQYEQVRSGPISEIFPSSLTNWQANFLNDPNTNVLSAVVDFVF